MIESVLHFAYGVHGRIDVRIACEHEERRVSEVALRRRRCDAGVYLRSLLAFGLQWGYYILKACVGRYNGGDGVDLFVCVWC